MTGILTWGRRRRQGAVYGPRVQKWRRQGSRDHGGHHRIWTLPSSLAADQRERGVERRRDPSWRGRGRRIQPLPSQPTADPRKRERRDHGICEGGEEFAGSTAPVLPRAVRSEGEEPRSNRNDHIRWPATTARSQWWIWLTTTVRGRSLRSDLTPVPE
uniref:Uncharacterized protein n=1 Tax=Oryza nivara TaxID=4536 RepID=A0A0E0HYQ7_ORYNI